MSIITEVPKGKSLEMGDKAKAWEWLEYLPHGLRRRVMSGEYFVEVSVAVSPEMAASLRAGQRLNRRFNLAWAEQLSRSIEDGGWDNTSVTLKTDKNGQLWDGQHRTWCIEGTGKTVLCAISFNEPFSFNIDRERKRTAKDELDFKGHNNTALLAAVGRLMWSDDTGNVYDGQPRASDQEAVRSVERHPEIARSIEAVCRGGGMWPRGFCQLRFLVFAHHKAAKVDEELAAIFFSLLRDPLRQVDVPDHIRTNVRLLFNILRNAAESKDRVMPYSKRLAWISKAWSACLEDRALGHLHWDHKREPFPMFPSGGKK